MPPLTSIEDKSQLREITPACYNVVVMTYRGQGKNGVVVIEGPIRPDDGTVVTVQPIDQPRPLLTPGTAEAILSCDAHWHGPPEEVDRLLEELRRDKWAEVQAQL